MIPALVLLVLLLVVLVPAWLERRADRRAWVPAILSPAIYIDRNGIAWHDVIHATNATINLNTWKKDTP